MTAKSFAWGANEGRFVGQHSRATESLGGGDGGGSDMERLVKVESEVKHVVEDVTELRKDVRELRGDIKTLDGKIERHFHITWGGIITAVLGLAWLISKAAKWL